MQKVLLVLKVRPAVGVRGGKDEEDEVEEDEVEEDEQLEEIEDFWRGRATRKRKNWRICRRTRSSRLWRRV